MAEIAHARRAAAGLAGGLCPAAARGGTLTEFTVFGAPGVKSVGVLVGESLRGMRNPPVALAGLEGVRGGKHGCGGGSARRSSLASARLNHSGLGCVCCGLSARARSECE